jgi:hypothetical protein
MLHRLLQHLYPLKQAIAAPTTAPLKEYDKRVEFRPQRQGATSNPGMHLTDEGVPGKIRWSPVAVW